MLFKGVGSSVRMTTEHEWMDELEIEISNRIEKRKIGMEIAQKYGQRLERKHLEMDIGQLERHFAHKAMIGRTIPNKYSLRQIARIVDLPLHYLNALRINGLIKYEQIGRANYLELDRLSEELKSEIVINFLEERFPNYKRR